MMTPIELRDEERKHGADAAVGMLLLVGPDRFDGEYSTTLICLEQIETSEKDIARYRTMLETEDHPTWRGVYLYNIGKEMGRIARCREMLNALAEGYQDRVKMGLHYV